MKRILAAIVCALLVYEGATLTNEATGDTISEIVWTLTDRWPVVALAFGVLMGHFFWPRRHQ